MVFGAEADSSIARGRGVFETTCAPCHGAAGGGGGYLTGATRPPRIAGEDVADVLQHVRRGGHEMPAFSSVALPDARLHDVARYVHETLVEHEPTPLGPRELGPFSTGLIAWAALLVLAIGLALLFAERRN
jgi:ubiquinol-cytochrome c reductase cytochrome c subunit